MLFRSRKAAKLYAAIDNSVFYANSVAPESRSWMNVPFTLANAELDVVFLKEASARGLMTLKGHRSVGGMRASIYNAMPEAGVDALVERLKNRKTTTIIGGNIGKNTLSTSDQYIDDYAQTFEKLHAVVDYFVVNISCPNVGSMAKLQDKDFILELLNTLQGINEQKQIQKPILLKIAPDLNDQQLYEIIEVVLAAKIQGVIASNTATNRAGLKMSEAE